MAIKASLGKLEAPDGLVDTIRDQGFQILDITAEYAWAVRDLPSGIHKDPFDRLLAAQALAEGLPVISADSELDQYEVNRRW